jgi:hypothetical protein
LFTAYVIAPSPEVVASADGVAGLAVISKAVAGAQVRVCAALVMLNVTSLVAGKEVAEFVGVNEALTTQSPIAE